MNITWNGIEHKEFYMNAMARCDRDDSYHRALFYALGACPDVRRHIDNLYDFSDRCIMPEGLEAGWITGGSRRVLLLAFNLFNGFTLDGSENLSSPNELFDCEYAPYMLTAIRIRYPEYCGE